MFGFDNEAIMALFDSYYRGREGRRKENGVLPHMGNGV